MSDDSANPEPSVPVEIVAGARINGVAGDNDHAPPVAVTGERAGAPERPALIAFVSIGVALSILMHGAFLGVGLLHLPLRAPANEEALPVTVVPDTAQPETKPPAPETAVSTEKPKPAAPETPAPKEEPKPPTPQTQEEKAPPPQPQTSAPQPPTPQPPPPETPPLPPSAPKTPSPQSAASPPASATAGPAQGVLADKLAEGVAAQLRAEIQRCWTIPTGWKSPHQVTVVMDVLLDRKGALAAHPVLLEFSASELGMAAAKNALAAVARCAPYKLPPDKFSQWRETQVRLAPD